MANTVIKRDKKEVEFDESKILKAINKANDSVDDENKLSEDKIQLVVEKVTRFVKKQDKPVSVEEIQNKTEEELVKQKAYFISKNYIKYRFLKEMSRDKYKTLMKGVKEKLLAENIQNQNANVDELSFGGRTGEASDLVAKRYALDYLVSPMARENHLRNEIYIHDLNSYATGCHNCLSVPFDHLLKNGFNTRQTDVRPAQSVNTACQLIAVLFQLQSLQQFGGVAATHFDWTLVPYVRKSFFKHYRDGLQYVEELEEDKIKEKLESIENLCKEELSISSDVYKEYSKAYKYAYKKLLDEIEQSISALFHNLNTLQSRSGNQLPFTSINYGTCTLEEGRLITKFVLETSIKGIGKKKRTSIFPCQIFQCMKGVNRKPGDPNYDLFQLALKSTSLRLYPNFTNCDWAGNAGYDKNDPRTFFSTIDKKTCGIM